LEIHPVQHSAATNPFPSAALNLNCKGRGNQSLNARPVRRRFAAIYFLETMAIFRQLIRLLILWM
jgi:hypothetical protein